MGICSQLDDEACAARAQRGDSVAFSELVARYQDRIYRFLARLIRSPDDAQELTQETFLRAYEALARWTPDARLSTWLFRIARNLAFDWLRRGKRVGFVPLDEDVAASPPTPRPHPTRCWRRRSATGSLKKHWPELGGYPAASRGAGAAHLCR